MTLNYYAHANFESAKAEMDRLAAYGKLREDSQKLYMILNVQIDVTDRVSRHSNIKHVFCRGLMP